MMPTSHTLADLIADGATEEDIREFQGSRTYMAEILSDVALVALDKVYACEMKQPSANDETLIELAVWRSIISTELMYRDPEKDNNLLMDSKLTHAMLNRRRQTTETDMTLQDLLMRYGRCFHQRVDIRPSETIDDDCVRERAVDLLLPLVMLRIRKIMLSEVVLDRWLGESKATAVWRLYRVPAKFPPQVKAKAYEEPSDADE